MAATSADRVPVVIWETEKSVSETRAPPSPVTGVLSVGYNGTESSPVVLVLRVWSETVGFAPVLLVSPDPAIPVSTVQMRRMEASGAENVQRVWSETEENVLRIFAPKRILASGIIAVIYNK